MAQWVKAPATKSSDLSQILIHMVASTSMLGHTGPHTFKLIKIQNGKQDFLKVKTKSYGKYLPRVYSLAQKAQIPLWL